MMKIVKYKVLVLMLMIIFSAVEAGGTPAEARPVSRRAGSLEKRADNSFIRGDYEKAMAVYSEACACLSAGEQKSALELKLARLYTLLQNPEETVVYYDSVRNAADTLLTVNDVCAFLDALRQCGKQQLAEIMARRYAYRAPYDRDRRFLNTLEAISGQRYYYGKGDSDYAVTLLSENTSAPEYWIGSWRGVPFYAVCQSSLQDPMKIYYHRTAYFALNSDQNSALVRFIPLEMQGGPVAFSPDGNRMIATDISDPDRGRIRHLGESKNLFVPQLYQSVSLDGRRWKRSKPLFGDQQDYSYAHPALCDEGRTLVFSSDRPGGFGGMDLYISRYDDKTDTWSRPENLGKEINTEGDEIYPFVQGRELHFSSNGQEGAGGYDIFRIDFADGKAIQGTLFHYSYPINTSFNDFGAFFAESNGYFISDRRGLLGRDDIYSFARTVSPLGSQDAVGISEESAAMSGNLNQISGLRSSNNQTVQKELCFAPTYTTPEEGDVLVSIYFDFNDYSLDADALKALSSLLQNPALQYLDQLWVLGYADDFGSEIYNRHLSQQRADAVADYLAQGAIPVRMLAEGRGKKRLSVAEYLDGMAQLYPQGPPLAGSLEVSQSFSAGKLSTEQRIELNRKVRRVDIIVKKK